MFTQELESVLPELRGYARMLSRDRDIADDIVQNACLKAWTARKTFDPIKGSFKAWMFTITRNEFIQYMRKSKRTDFYAPSDLENWLVEDCQITNRATCSEVIRELFLLPPDQRDVFILVVAVGYSYEEAANICDCEIGTLKSRINRARKKLTAALNAPNGSKSDSAPSETGFHDVTDIFGYAEKLVKKAA